MVNAGKGFSPRTEVENPVETRRADTRCGERRFEDVRRFATPDRSGRWKGAIAPGREKSAAGPDCAAACAPTDTPSPKQMAAPLSPPLPWQKVPPTFAPATPTPASRSRCDAAACQPGKWKRSFHNRRAVRDWNKTRVVRAPAPGRNQKGYCRKERCAGSKSRSVRSAGNTTA